MLRLEFIPDVGLMLRPNS